MNETKAQSRSVTMTEKMWEATDAHAESIGTDRSTYIRGLVIKDLASLDKLPNSPRAEVLEMVDALFETMGPDAVKAEIEAIASKSLQTT